MKQIIDFLATLQRNNNRPWFQAHKAEYQAAQSRFDNFTELLIKEIAKFDPTISGLTVKDCSYRIYRDTRFSEDKTPYKTHMGAFIVRGGKKSGYAGYYFQVGPQEGGFPGGNLLASGNYCFEPAALKTIREDICNGEGDFDRIVKAAPLFQLDPSDSLKRNPKGFAADAPYGEYLRLRSYCLVWEPGREAMLAPDLLQRVADAFRTTQPFIDYVNRAIAFSRDEL